MNCWHLQKTLSNKVNIMILSKVEQVRKDIKDNPLKTAKDKKRFKKLVLDNVDDLSLIHI